MSGFLIGGSIVDDGAQKWAPEDVSPADVRDVLASLDEGEGVTFDITSPGGSCTAGIAIANMIRQASSEGHPTKAHVVGMAASMASVIACACDVVEMDESAFMMIHNPWSSTEGSAEDLRREADTLDKFKRALMGFYRSKFDLDDERISGLMDDETWFTGREAGSFNFACDVIPSDEPLRAVAAVRTLPAFNRAPDGAKRLLRTKDMEQEKTETKEPAEKPVETPEQTVAEQLKEALSDVEDEKTSEETVTKAEADARVSGMQSKMAKQIDAVRKDCEGRVKAFQDQLMAKDEELTKARAEVTSLGKRLEAAEVELRETASALAEKTDALAKLNADVNTPNEGLPTLAEGLAKCATPTERSAFIASGKYKPNR